MTGFHPHHPSRLLFGVALVALVHLSSVGWAQTSASGTATTTAAALQRTGSLEESSTSPRVFSPTMPRLAYTKYPWKTDIVATVFWVGEEPTENNPTPNNKSSWDTRWEENFGGYDDPDPMKRTSNFLPKGFTPGLNPFYIALPYNDLADYTKHKSEASRVIPWFKQRFTRNGTTVLRGTWVAIRYGNRVCYAQWEDCGPFVTDDWEYVFGDKRPKNPKNKGAGIDISPAIRDYLGIPGHGKCDWRFVDVNEVPAGPWRMLGSNNHFVQSQQQNAADQKTQIASRLEELRRLRDEYFKRNGNNVP